MAKSKKELIKKGKELGLNLDESMSMYELEHRIADAEAENKEKPKAQKSKERGEY